MQLDPQAVDTATAQLTLLSDPSGILAVDGAVIAESTTAAGENIYLTFSGTAGQNLSLALGNFVSSPPGTGSSYSVNLPNGGYLTSGSCTAPGCHVALPTLPSTGTYSVTVDAPGTSFNMSFAAGLSSDLTGSLTSNTAFPLNLTKPGQTARVTFPGSVGQLWGVALGSVTTSPAGGNVALKVYNPDGTLVGGASTQTTTSTLLNLPALAQSGPFTVQLEPQYADTANAQVTLVPNPSASLTVDGTTVAENTPTPGENVYLTFNGTAGQNLSFALNNFATSPAGGNPSYSFHKPDGTFLGSGSCIAPGCHTALTNLPQTGVYTITINAPSSTSSMSFNAGITSDVSGALMPNSPFGLSLSSPGRVARLTFSGSIGQVAGIYIASVASMPAGANVNVSTFAPDGTAVSGGSGGIASNGTINLPVLSQSGTYTIQIDPTAADTATAQVELLTASSLAINGSSVTVPTGGQGQNFYFTFGATAGQNITAKISNLVTNPAGGQAYVAVAQPNGSRLSYVFCQTSSCPIALSNVPTTGTYVLTVTAPTVSSTMSFSSAVTSP